MPNYIFNVKHFGAKGDGVTDDLPAFNAAMAAMGVAPTAGGPPGIVGPGFTPSAWQGGKLLVPAPDVFYYLSDRLRVYRGTVIEGEGAGLERIRTLIKFAKGKSGIVCENVYASLDGGRGDHSIIRNLYLDGGGGYSSGNYTDHQWAASTVYSLGDVVLATKFLPYGWAFKCTTAGTSGSTEPAWSSAAPVINAAATTYNDGTVVWTAIQAHGIVLSDFVTVENCIAYGFPGNGFDCTTPSTALGDPTFCNDFTIRNCQARDNGGSGFYSRGNDANAALIQRCKANGNMGIGFVDRTLLGNKWDMCESSENFSGNYYAENGHWGAPYDEAGEVPVVMATGAHLYGGSGLGSGLTRFKINAFATSTAYALGDWVAPTVDNDYWYKVTSAGTTGGSEPTWPVGFHKTVTSGTVTFTCLSFAKFSDGKIIRTPLDESPAHHVSERSGTRIVSIVGDYEGDKTFAQFARGPVNAEEATWKLKYDDGNHVVFELDGNSAYRPILLCEDGSSEGAGELAFPNGFNFGSAGVRVKHTAGDVNSPPGSSVGRVGSVIWNNTNDSGFLNGWYCVANAPSAVWIPFWLPGSPYIQEPATGVGSPFALPITRAGGVVWTDANGGGSVVGLALPAVSGSAQRVTFEFYVKSTNGIRVIAPGGVKIQLGASQSTAGGYVESTAQGSFLTLAAIGGDPVWVAKSIVGTWSAA